MPPATLATALQCMPPRDAQVVLNAVAGGPPLTELYGITQESADVLLLRASQALTATLKSERAAPLSPDEERRQATELRAALSNGAAPFSPSGVGGGRTADALVELKTHLSEVRALLAQAEAAADASPARARETQLRWLAIAVILALTAFFYWQEAHKPLPPPQPRPTAPHVPK